MTVNAYHPMQPTHVYEVRPRNDHRGIALPFGRLWHGGPDAVTNALTIFRWS